MVQAAIDHAVSRFASARRVTVLTGAGVSAASGVPTFRGAAGLWRQFRPEDLATAAAFAGATPAFAQESAPGPGKVVITIIPGGATFFN